MMADKKNTQRVRVLKEGMKRLTRLLEAENASLQSLMKTEARNSGGNISTGLGSFLSDGVAIAPKPTVSYEDFAKGVWTGIDDTDGANSIVVEFAPADRGTAGNDDLAPYAPRLGIHPVITSAQSPKWVTLETMVDKTSISVGATLRLDIVTDFHFPEPRQATHINTAKMTLRCQKNDGTYDDIEFGSFPVTTVPMAHTLSNPYVKIDATTLAHCAKMVLIFFLPNHGLYTFNLYGFSVGTE